MASRKKALAYDGQTFREVIIEEDGTIHHVSHLNIDKFLDDKRKLEEAHKRSGFGHKDHYMRPKFEITPQMADQACREGWFHDADKWNKIFNDANYKYLRYDLR